MSYRYQQHKGAQLSYRCTGGNFGFQINFQKVNTIKVTQEVAAHRDDRVYQLSESSRSMPSHGRYCGHGTESTFQSRRPPKQRAGPQHGHYHCLICDKHLGNAKFIAHLLSNKNEHGILVEKNKLIYHLDQSLIKNIKVLSTYTNEICAKFYENMGIPSRFKCKLCGKKGERKGRAIFLVLR